ncbi:MAG: MinD/ParA family protein [Gammaproteobacteria bacterium]
MQANGPVRVFAVTSGKGGVGKTNVSVNLGTALAESGHSVVLFDADMGLANVDVLLGLSPRYNFFHVLEGTKSLAEVIVRGPSGLMLVPGASGIQKMAELSPTEQAAVIRSFSEFEEDIDVLIVDTAAGISSNVVNFAKACQEVVVVVCDEPTSLTDAYAFIKLLNRDHGLGRFQVLTNRMASAEQGRTLFTKLCKVTDQFLDVNLSFLGAVPEDSYLRQSVQKQVPVVQLYAQSPSAQAFRNIARKIENWPLTPQAGGNLEFFVERMIGVDFPGSEVPA